MAPSSYYQPMVFHGPPLLSSNQKYCLGIMIIKIMMMMALLDIHSRMNGHPSFNILCPKRIYRLSLKLRKHFVSSYA